MHDIGYFILGMISYQQVVTLISAQSNLFTIFLSCHTGSWLVIGMQEYISIKTCPTDYKLSIEGIHKQALCETIR